jgi:cyclopropane fatty-acyl-phospholipid synthase-like methyltransferase
MKPANDPAVDYRALVARGYNAVATDFNASRAGGDAQALTPLLARLRRGARVLDLGCGAGAPIARTLSDAGFDVVGIDLSAGQLALARLQAPGVALLRGDMTTCAFAPASFDAVVSFYAIFHLPREQHEALFTRIASWLRPGGYLMASLATHDEPAYTEDFFGAEMYWSNYGIETYRAMLDRCRFDVLAESTLTHGYDDDGAAKPESHPVVFAQRR